MTLDQVILDDKQIAVIKDRHQVIFGEGTTNSGKSFIFGIAFILRIMESPATHTQFFLGGKSLPVLEKMYMQNPDSFYNIFKSICTYTNAGQGGAKIVINMQGIKPNKIIYLAGYDNKKRWSDILGLTIYGFNIEEINIADNDFISELFIRVFRNGGFLYATSNGGDPDIPVYANHLNDVLGLYIKLTDYYSEELNIEKDISVEVELRQLAELHKEITGLPLNWYGTYNSAAQRVITRLKKEQAWAMV